MHSLPLPPISPRFPIQVEFPEPETRILILTFDWNSRSESWSLQVSDLAGAGVVLLAGQAIRPGIKLLEGTGILQGDLLVYDSVGDTELSYESLASGRHQLVYLSPEEI